MARLENNADGRIFTVKEMHLKPHEHTDSVRFCYVPTKDIKEDKKGIICQACKTHSCHSFIPTSEYQLYTISISLSKDQHTRMIVSQDLQL